MGAASGPTSIRSSSWCVRPDEYIAIRLADDDAVRAAYRAVLAAGIGEVVGSSDHGVSHSLYIKDPDGIEIELYADVPGWKEEGLGAVSGIKAWDPR